MVTLYAITITITGSTLGKLKVIVASLEKRNLTINPSKYSCEKSAGNRSQSA